MILRGIEIMNKKQLVVMWIGIVLMVLLWWYAPKEIMPYKAGSYERETTYNLVQPAKLFANWILVGFVTGGLIITFKGKKTEDEQKGK